MEIVPDNHSSMVARDMGSYMDWANRRLAFRPKSDLNCGNIEALSTVMFIKFQAEILNSSSLGLSCKLPSDEPFRYKIPKLLPLHFQCPKCFRYKTPKLLALHFRYPKDNMPIPNIRE